MKEENTILHHMALAFFASAFADLAEENDEPLRGEIMDQLPDEIDPAAINAANTLALGLVNANLSLFPTGNAVMGADCAMLLLLNRAKQIQEENEQGGDRELNAEMFGHYLAMQAMGHGVGLWDSFGSEVYNEIKVPYVEFGSHSLEKDYFADPEGGEHAA